jgi:hypothetical protein
MTNIYMGMDFSPDCFTCYINFLLFDVPEILPGLDI